MKVIRVDQDTVVEVTERERLVKISELIAEHGRRVASNKMIDRLEQFRASAPEELRPYIHRLPKLDVEELQQKIDEYKSLK